MPLVTKNAFEKPKRLHDDIIFLMHQVGIDEPMLEAQAHAYFDQDLGKREEKAIE